MKASMFEDVNLTINDGEFMVKKKAIRLGKQRCWKMINRSWLKPDWWKDLFKWKRIKRNMTNENYA